MEAGERGSADSNWGEVVDKFGGLGLRRFGSQHIHHRLAPRVEGGAGWLKRSHGQGPRTDDVQGLR
jgi:hypothetical protein